MKKLSIELSFTSMVEDSCVKIVQLTRTTQDSGRMKLMCQFLVLIIDLLQKTLTLILSTTVTRLMFGL